MDGLKNYREKIKSIEKLVNKMESGELSIHELLELETLTGDLHERSIILKYKAFENKFEDSNSDQEDPDESLVDQIEEVLEEADIEEAEIEKEEASAMDFSMFGEPETDAKHQEIETENDAAIEEVEKPTPVVEKKPHQVTLTPNYSIEEADAQHQDLGTESDLVNQKGKAVNEDPKVVVEKKAEPEIKPEIVAEEPKVVVKEKGSSFLDRLSIVDNSISAQLGGRKIDTLSGAFGINQRLLYINELFDGSGEAFSDAVKTLDTQANLDAASDKVEEMAFKNSWNPEEDVVLEFLAIIKRRYA